MGVKINDLETRRFGVLCAGFDGRAPQLPDLEAINRQAQQQAIAMISVRVDVCALNRVHALEADGYRLMDTLVYYTGPLKHDRPTPPLPAGVSFRAATPQDSAAVGKLASKAFENYIGHYHADPKLDNTAADAAYVEWAETSVGQASAQDMAFLALKEGSITAFLTTKKRAGNRREIILNGVDPAHQGQGLYAGLLDASSRMIDGDAQTRLTISTQINNYSVQRVWSRMGLVHSQSFYTFHKWFDS